MTEPLTVSARWVSAPGETIRDLLEERHLSYETFAVLTEQDSGFVQRLLQGKAPITNALAHKLESVLGASVAFWLRRESRYRENLARSTSVESNEAKAIWLKSLPTKEMVALGWLPPLPDSVKEATESCLRFFGEPNIASWHRTYPAAIPMAAFRTSPTFDSETAAVSTWLRQGELEAEKIPSRSWNPESFRASLAAARSLTRTKDPAVFLPILQSVCAAAGVAVVIVRAPTSCRASGATCFINRDKALIMLSFRYLSDDHFWFTFFHEAGHLLLHTDEDVFLEGVAEGRSNIETEANNFAARLLVPPEFEPEMLRLSVNAHAVIKFARKAGIAPGIVVGQMQHRGKFTQRQLNNLKRRYSWVDN